MTIHQSSDDNNAKPTLPTVNSNHNNKTPVETMVSVNNSDYMESYSHKAQEVLKSVMIPLSNESE